MLTYENYSLHNLGVNERLAVILALLGFGHKVTLLLTLSCTLPSVCLLAMSALICGVTVDVVERGGVS